MSENPAGTRAVIKKNAFPVYAVGLVWLVWAFLLPLYEPMHYLMCAAVSAVAFFVLNAVAPKKTEYVKEPEILTGNEAADELLKTGRALISEIDAADVQDPEVEDQLDQLCDISERILDYVVQKPETAGQLRRFFNFYLPTLKKLAETYALMEKQGVEGENIGAAMQRITAMLNTMDEAFEKQLDALFSETTLDISTDITVMQQMMAQEGLAEDENQLNMN